MRFRLKNPSYFIFFIVFLAFITVLSVFIYIGSKPAMNLSDVKNFTSYHKVVDIKNNVIVHSSDGNQECVDLPYKFSSDNTYYFTFLAEPVSEEDALYMYIKGAYLEFTLTCDNELIYEYKPFDTDKIKSGGQLLRFIKIPDKYLGKEVKIEFKPVVRSSYGIRIPDIKLGTVNDLIQTVRESDGLVSFISLILMVFSIEFSIMLFVLIIYKKISFSTLLIPLFSYTVAEYVVISSVSFFFMFPKGNFIYVVDYVLLMLCSLSLTVFLTNMAFKNELKKWKICLSGFISFAAIINIFVQSFLTYMGYSEFMKMQRITHTLFIIQFVFLLVMVITNRKKSENSKGYLFVAVAVNIIFFIIFIQYHYTSSLDGLSLLGIGGIMFVIFEISIAIRVYSKTYKEYYVSELNKNLALIDNLTRLGNRNAFEKEIEEIKVDKYDNILFMVLDISNLKKINDTYGHSSGDIVISALAGIINSAQRKFTTLKAYRLGGDEFIIIAKNVNLAYATELANYINNKGQKYRKENPELPFSFGLGYDILEGSNGVNLIEFISTVDEKMYEDKKLKKESAILP